MHVVEYNPIPIILGTGKTNLVFHRDAYHLVIQARFLPCSKMAIQKIMYLYEVRFQLAEIQERPKFIYNREARFIVIQARFCLVVFSN